jgi:hypothetical protein
MIIKSENKLYNKKVRLTLRVGRTLLFLDPATKRVAGGRSFIADLTALSPEGSSLYQHHLLHDDVRLTCNGVTIFILGLDRCCQLVEVDTGR